jgi:hypothetical protein
MKTKLCKSWLSQEVGLMFSGRKKAVFFLGKEQRICVHTFFVFFPILVEFLDSKRKVVERTVMRPFSFYYPKHKAKYIVETPLKESKL